ncbi:MAG: ribulose-phosphate 3-epimerase, partial [Clostridia bacterium]|nr:ribulose-phosphate 3-epimerase [Clostridia bacterium]
FIPSSLENGKKIREYALSVGKDDLDIEIDGGVTCDNAEQIRAAGANVLVAGSAVFGAPDKAAAISKIRGGN